jgi:nicotinate-nucleotide adenylyltransferase
LKIGILGGTFDPIHYGHLIIAEGVAEKLQLDKVMFIPTGDSPHKNSKDVTDKMHRLFMTQLATEDNPVFEVSSMEIQRKEICYTVDTAKLLKEEYPNSEIYYIVGADSLRDMKEWKNPKGFLKLLKIAACRRVVNNNTNLDKWAKELIESFNADITVVNLPLIELSSTEIRERIKSGKSVKYMLPDKVIEYINENRLYE